MGKIRSMPAQPVRRPTSSGPASKVRHPHRSVRRKRRAKWIFWVLLGIFITTAAVILSRTVFFFITDFEVVGNVHYSADQLVSTAAIPMGENLFKADRASAEENIIGSMPYVDEVDVGLRLPSTIVIEVTETTPKCMIRWGDRYYLTDMNTKVLELASGDVTGMTRVYFDAPGAEVIVGQRFLSGDNEELLEKFRDVYGALEQTGLIDGVTYIDMRDPFAVTFGWGDLLTVEIGAPTALEDKLAMFTAIEPELSEKGEKGVLDITQPAKGFFEADK